MPIRIALIGEGAAQEQSVVGETPNLAARLQTLAEPNTVVIAAGTAAGVNHPSSAALGRPSPSPPDCLRLARQIRDLARTTRLPEPRGELLRLAMNYSRRGDHLDGTRDPRKTLTS